MEEIKKILVQLMEGQEAMKIDIGGMKNDIGNMKYDIVNMKNDIKKIDFTMEELDKKVDFSLEGHKTNTEQLNRIENEVSKQQEIILRKVR